MNMDWFLSPPGLVTVIVSVVIVALLIYWKRKPIRKWFTDRKVDVEVQVGPLKVGLGEKDKPQEADAKPAGVDFGEGGDFSRTTIKDVAGRDIRRGSADAEPSGGRTPGVSFGKKGKFGNAEIKDVAGRDLIED